MSQKYGIVPADDLVRVCARLARDESARTATAVTQTAATVRDARSTTTARSNAVITARDAKLADLQAQITRVRAAADAELAQEQARLEAVETEVQATVTAQQQRERDVVAKLATAKQQLQAWDARVARGPLRVLTVDDVAMLFARLGLGNERAALAMLVAKHGLTGAVLADLFCDDDLSEDFAMLQIKAVGDQLRVTQAVHAIERGRGLRLEPVDAPPQMAQGGAARVARLPTADSTVEDVCAWLAQGGMDSSVCAIFRTHRISGDVAPLLEKRQLGQMGIANLSVRTALLKLVQKLPRGERDADGGEADSANAPAAEAQAGECASPAEPPTRMLCPITHDLMEDPVMASDGHTYERVAIAQWLGASGNKSPLTNEVIPPALYPNHDLRSQIQDFKKANKLKEDAAKSAEKRASRPPSRA